jgi:hypothetical protein
MGKVPVGFLFKPFGHKRWHPRRRRAELFLQSSIFFKGSPVKGRHLLVHTHFVEIADDHAQPQGKPRTGWECDDRPDCG